MHTYAHNTINLLSQVISLASPVWRLPGDLITAVSVHYTLYHMQFSFRASDTLKPWNVHCTVYHMQLASHGKQQRNAHAVHDACLVPW